MKKQLINHRDQKMVRAGDHMVLLYDDKIEPEETIYAYIYECLNRNEKVFFISGDLDANKIYSNIVDDPIFDKVKLEKQFILFEKEDVYAKEGKFDSDKMISLLITEAEKALSEGFSALSITGEISWVLEYEDGFDAIEAYEWKLNEYVFNKHKVTSVCRYNMDKFTDEMILNIIKLHPIIIWNDEIHENPFYLPSEGYLKKDIPKYQVKTWLENISKYTYEKARFSKEITNLKQAMSNQMTKAYIRMLEIHDPYTHNHSENVASLAKDFASYIGLSEYECEMVYNAGIVHDIGKLLIPNTILNKNDSLSDEEFDIIKKHPFWAWQSLNEFKELEPISHIVKHHHERVDGKGYPEGLSGEKLSKLCKIVSIVDAFDAMTHDRAYRKAMTFKESVEEIIRNKNKQFEGELVDLFVKFINNRKIC